MITQGLLLLSFMFIIHSFKHPILFTLYYKTDTVNRSYLRD